MITGIQSDDTILVGEQANPILTAITGWLEEVIDLDGKAILRPAVFKITLYSDYP